MLRPTARHAEILQGKLPSASCFCKDTVIKCKHHSTKPASAANEFNPADMPQQPLTHPSSFLHHPPAQGPSHAPRPPAMRGMT